MSYDARMMDMAYVIWPRKLREGGWAYFEYVWKYRYIKNGKVAKVVYSRS